MLLKVKGQNLAFLNGRASTKIKETIIRISKYLNELLFAHNVFLVLTDLNFVISWFYDWVRM